MKKKMIADIRLRLDFMEESDALVSKAQRQGDKEWEYDLHAHLSSAENDLGEFVAELLGDRQEEQDCTPILTTNSGISLRSTKKMDTFAPPRRAERALALPAACHADYVSTISGIIASEAKCQPFQGKGFGVTTILGIKARV